MAVNHLDISEMARRVPFFWPTSSNKVISTSFSDPFVGCSTETVTLESGKFSGCSRWSKNGSASLSMLTDTSSLTSSPILTNRSAIQSPKAFLFKVDINTSRFVLYCINLSLSSVTGPSSIPTNLTPNRSSKVFARATK